MKINNKISSWLKNSNQYLFSIYAVLAAFSTYACMYAFRKPFTAATFAGLSIVGIDLKTALITLQVVGYMLSKFIGIKFVSEMPPQKRAWSIIALIVIAEISLLLFAVVPLPYNIIFLFFNGLPLGMVWGLVFSFLEGRKLTELLGAGLSISFIISSGFVKSVGVIVMESFGFNEFQMPFITGLIFTIPLIFFVWMLNQIPPPSIEDENLRTKRKPMNKEDRKKFFHNYAAGIIILTIIYMFLSAFRDMRDNFVADVWKELGYNSQPFIFTFTELPIALVVLIIVGSMFLIKDNLKAFLINHYLILFGILLTGLSSLLYQIGLISPIIWMIGVGLGLYLGYVPFNCILFDRFIAVSRTAANAGFLIYIADSFGYLASVATLF